MSFKTLKPARTWPPYLFAMSLALSAVPAFAIDDEIQVYTDDINKPGEYGLELHMNTTPAGRSTPNYPGDSIPRHGFRLTPEFSYGLTRDFEAGLYLPTVRDADGSLSAAGVKLRLKWLPLKPEEGAEGFYGGVNFELARVDQRYSQTPLASEVRMIGGYRAEKWLIGINPILDFDLSPGYRNGGPDFVFGLKAMREVLPGISLGTEYYTAVGKLTHPLPHSLQENTLYLVMDYDRKPWVFNFGVGRGMTGATDQWTVKAIFDVPF
jgi:hypothetical protein